MSNVADATKETDAHLRAQLSQMIEGYRITALLHVAARLRIADLLRDGPINAEALAVASETHAPSLVRLLRGLVVLGILTEISDARFELTALGVPLQKEAPRSLRGSALRAGDETEMRVWGNLLHSVKTGEPVFDHVVGMSAYEYLASNPRLSAGFNRAMVDSTTQTMPAILAAYDFSRFSKVVDVGGGSGALIAAILRANPASRGIVFDTPAGTAAAAAFLEDAGVAERCEVVSGDFLADPLPAGADAYAIKSVLDNWDDGSATSLLKNCRQAIAPAGRLVVIAPVLPETVEPPERNRAIVMFDINMMTSGGRERSEAEFAALFASAGFKLNAMIPTTAEVLPYSVIEGVPV